MDANGADERLRCEIHRENEVTGTCARCGRAFCAIEVEKNGQSDYCPDCYNATLDELLEDYERVKAEKPAEASGAESATEPAAPPAPGESPPTAAKVADPYFALASDDDFCFFEKGGAKRRTGYTDRPPKAPAKPERPETPDEVLEDVVTTLMGGKGQATNRPVPRVPIKRRRGRRSWWLRQPAVEQGAEASHAEPVAPVVALDREASEARVREAMELAEQPALKREEERVQREERWGFLAQPRAVSETRLGRTRWRAALIIIIITTGIIAALLWALPNALLVKGDTEYGYKLSTVVRGDLVKKVTAAGTLEGTSPVDVLPAASARLASVAVREGDSVEAGQILASMDVKQLQENADQAKADYLTSASLGYITSSFFAGLTALNAGIAQGAVSLNGFQTQIDALAGTFFQLAPALIPLLPAPQQQQAQILLAQAQANYLSAVAGRQPIEPVEADISSGSSSAADSARQANAFRQYEKALAALDNAEIRAPASGTVIFVAQAGFLSPDFIPSLLASLQALTGGLSILGGAGGISTSLTTLLSGLQPQSELKAGTTVSEHSPVFQIVDLRDMTIRAQVEETDIPLLEQGQAVEAKLDAVPDETFNGTVVQVGAKAKSGSAGNTVFDAVIQLNRADTSLRIGYNATVDIIVLDLRDSLIIPLAAVLQEGGSNYVWLDAGGRAHKQQVQLGAQSGDSVQVTGGLGEGDVIVSEGAAKIKEGQKLK